MLLVLTNIPTPYRSAFFNELQVETGKIGLDFHVLYCAKTEPRRNWTEASLALNHSHEIMWGIHPSVAGIYPHINPSIVKKLVGHKAKFLLIAGAWNTPTMLMSLLCYSRRNSKSIFWSEGHQDAVLYSRGIIPWLRRFVYSKFDAFAVPNSKSAKWALSNCGSEKPILILPNAIDCDRYRRKNEAERFVARTELGLPGHSRILVQVAGLEERKGAIQLAESFLEIPLALRRDAILAFVGGGPLEGALRHIAFASNNSVIVTGAIQPIQVRQWLMAADAFLLNTFQDPNPLAPIEAGTAELPVAISALAGNSDEIIGTHGGGWIIDNPRDPKSIVQTILTTSSDDLVRMGRINASKCAATFSARAVACNFLSQILDLH